MSIEGLAVLSVLIVSGLSALFVYFYHENTRFLTARTHEAWKHAIAADQAARALSGEERAKFLDYIERVTKWNTTLVAQCQQSAAREVREVQRYMQAVQNDLISAVSNAAVDKMNKTRPMPTPVQSTSASSADRETPASGIPALRGL